MATEWFGALACYIIVFPFTRTIPLVLCLLAFCLLVQPSSASAFTIAAAGDISCPAESTAQHAITPGTPEPKPAAAKCQGHRVATMISQQNPEVVLAVGDLVQGQTSYAHAYSDFTSAWGDVLGTRIAASLGNHDYHRDGSGLLTAAGYFQYWKEQGAPVWRTGKPDDGWSSWNAGKWHMINLNSNCNAVDCTFTGPQLRWLIKDLKADRANQDTKCTLAYFHHPLFSAGVPLGQSGDRTLVGNLWELLYRYRTDLVVTGHQHFYERYLPQDPSGKQDETGITQIITGTGGASTFRTTAEDGQTAINSAASVRSLGATFLDLEDGSYSTRFRDMLGGLHDQVEDKACLAPNAGADERAPRTARYGRHMKRMTQLDQRISRLNRRIGQLRHSRKPQPKRLRTAEVTKIKVARNRARFRVKRLY